MHTGGCLEVIWRIQQPSVPYWCLHPLDTAYSLLVWTGCGGCGVVIANILESNTWPLKAVGQDFVVSWTFLESSLKYCTGERLDSCVSEMMKGLDPASNTLWIFPESRSNTHTMSYYCQANSIVLSKGKQLGLIKQGHTATIKRISFQYRTYRLTETECYARAGRHPELGPQRSWCSCSCLYKMVLCAVWSEPSPSFLGSSWLY